MGGVNPPKRLAASTAAWLARAVSEAASIRPARRGDMPAILEIYNTAVQEPASAYEDVPHTLKQREDWFAHFQQRNFPILVAEGEGAVTGWGSLGPHQERAGFRFTGAVALYVISMTSLFVLRKAEPDLERPFRAVCYPVFPALALGIAAVSFVAMAWFNPVIGGIFVGILVLGSGYFLSTRRGA